MRDGPGRVTVQGWINRIWYGRRPLWWAVPASLLFAGVTFLRRCLYRNGWLPQKRLSCPVIVVGNLSVGGTGKTPLVCWLTRQLHQRGWLPGIVIRGHGGSQRAPCLIENGDEADAARLGDEAVLLARRTGRPVAVGRNRPAAAQQLIDIGCNVIISDDGLQHYRLMRDVEIVVVDGDRGLGNGWMLPAGPLREPGSRLESVDAIIVNGGRGQVAGALGMTLDADEAVALVGDRRRPLSDFSGSRVNAVAGIGNPERFFNMLRTHGVQVTGRALDDHVVLTRSMITFDDDLPVLMTEKDAVKCSALADARHYYVPVSARFGSADEASLMNVIEPALPQQERPT